MEPSPTAEATRFTLSALISPTAKKTRKAGFERIWSPFQEPTFLYFVASFNETLCVEGQALEELPGNVEPRKTRA